MTLIRIILNVLLLFECIMMNSIFQCKCYCTKQFSIR